MGIWLFVLPLQQVEAAVHVYSCSIWKWRISKDENSLFVRTTERRGRRCVSHPEYIGPKLRDEPEFVDLLAVPWVAFKACQVAAEVQYLRKHPLQGCRSPAQTSRPKVLSSSAKSRPNNKRRRRLPGLGLFTYVHMLSEKAEAVWHTGRIEVRQYISTPPTSFWSPYSRAHESEKPYHCQFCNNKYKSKNEVERHQNSLHLHR